MVQEGCGREVVGGKAERVRKHSTVFKYVDAPSPQVSHESSRLER